MIKQLGAMSLCLIPAALLTIYTKALPSTPRNEAWLENHVPTEVTGYTFLKSEKDPKVSYKMDEVTYNELDPLGIAAQVYEDPKGMDYEVVVIAGDRMSNFHDQRVCFVAQGWNLLKNDTAQIATQGYGEVPVLDLTVAKDGKGQRPALFMWRSPRQFTNDRRVAKTDFFIDGLTGKPNLVGYSYRFMGVTEDATADGLKQFAAAYLNALQKVEAKGN